MPTRRLVVALAVLLVAVFGAGIVTALSRTGEKATPNAAPTQSPTATQPPFSEGPQATTPPPTTPPPTTAPPTVAPTTAPTGGNGGGGGGGGPKMPNTGGAPLLVACALGTAAVALGARRAVRH